MSRFNSVPVIVQQMVESLQNKKTPEHVRFNQAQVIETIKEYCDKALNEWNKEQNKKAIVKRR
jgi:hypothetical protein